jgi:DNA modification methylase
MRLLKLNQIRVADNRQRREFDPDGLAELADSISTNGLLHPIVVRQGEDGVYLVAGERRLRALEILELSGRHFGYGAVEVPAGMVPTNDLGELNPIEAEEAELAENVIRVDLSWQERTAAIARLARLKEIQHPGDSKPTFRQLGEQIFPEANPTAAGTTVRQAVVLQRHMAEDSEISKAKTESEAWKLVKRKEEKRVNEALALSVGKLSASELHTVVHADCRDWLAQAHHEQFDCVLIDPPYGMGADGFGNAAGKLVGIEHGYEDSRDHALGLMEAISADLWFVCKAEAHLYVWCDIEQYQDLRIIFAKQGWWVHRTPLVNVKREGGRVPWPEHGPRRCYELVLYAVKGKRPVTAIYRDVFESTLGEDTGGHGAAKPVEAYVDLLRRTCRPGDSVLDCFAGSGTILSAAHQLRLRATAVEVDPAYYGQCLKRLENLK